jgi:hypothetical protein
MGGNERELGLIDSVARVTMKDRAVILLEAGDIAGAGLPGRGRAEQNRIPVLSEESLAVVVPDGVQHAGAAGLLSIGDKALDVPQRHIEIRPYAIPVVHTGRNPGFHAGMRVGVEPAREALRFGLIVPGDGDHVVGQARDLIGAVHRHIAPEEQPPVQGSEGFVDPRQQVDVDGAEATLLHFLGGLAAAQLEGFVGADVEERARVDFRQLIEPLCDQLDRSRLAGREHRAGGDFGQRSVLLPEEDLVQMTEGFLLRNDGDVIGPRVFDQCFCVRRRQRTAGQSRQRIRGVLHRVLEVGRVDVELVSSKRPDLLLLVGQRGDGSARKVVVHAAPAHRRPVANGRALEDGAGAAATLELDEGLHAVEDARGRVPDDEDFMRAGDENVAFRLHRRVEAHLLAV